MAVNAAFQFHNGAIKRKSVVSAKRFKEMFQFHNGAIKSHN